MIPSIAFIALLIVTIFVFTRKVRSISRNINLGKELEIKDNKPKRWALMVKVAIGQLKMLSRPVPAIMHLFVYVGFIIVNIEMLEIIIDGIFGTHRVFSFIGSSYGILISSFEIFGIAVIEPLRWAQVDRRAVLQPYEKSPMGRTCLTCFVQF